MTFKELELIEPILRAVKDVGYETPTPIQEQSIPILLKGRDLLGSAQTGTGKTAAFSIPIIQQIYNGINRVKGKRRIKALIVTPTRELAIQIGDNIDLYAKYTGIKNTVIFGGVKQGKQTKRLEAGIDILVATPGRLLDLMGQGYISLRDIEYFVLDEADRMLDMGFIHDIRKLLKELPKNRQSLFFSATMPSSIVKLSRQILGDFGTVTIKPEQPTAELVEQSVYFVNKKSKNGLLIHLIKEMEMDTVLVFSRTKHGANKIVKKLENAKIKARAIHGNKSQNQRQDALKSFKDGEITVLVATDIAARGIDVKELSYVVNFDMPNIPETYVHRIGRTGRASASGIAISFCDMEERAYLKDIQKLIRMNIELVEDHPFTEGADVMPPKTNQSRGRGRSRQSGNSSNRRRTNNSNSDRRKKRRN